jgi:hypothetical protein
MSMLHRVIFSFETKFLREKIRLLFIALKVAAARLDQQETSLHEEEKISHWSTWFGSCCRVFERSKSLSKEGAHHWN